MKIAIPYANGEVFQHFGKTEAFKVYDIADGKVVSAEIVETNGAGHEALAAFLARVGVNAVICGGMGEGAQSALLNEGIEIYAGAQGSADDVIAMYLSGSLEAGEPECDCGHHHHHEEEECGCGGGCGDSCGGGCGGGCGCHSAPSFEGPNVGKTVKAHYRGTFDDGTEFDSSYGRGEPLEFVCGAGMMILGFDKAVANMEVGQVVNVHLMPDEAYGYPDPRAVFTFEISQLPGAEELTVDQHVYLYDNTGRPVPVRVLDKDEKTITFDANHEMAGKELNFMIELVEVK